MRCTEPLNPGYAFWSSWRGWALVAALGGSAWIAGCASRSPAPGAPAPAPAARPGSTAPAPATAARNAAEFRLQAAKRLVAANPNLTYLGEVPEPLLAIPVLEAELAADGSIVRINVLRYPTQAKDTTQVAIDAMKRGAPYGDMRHLPKPWRYTEAFLFNDDRRFKPRTLDE